MSRESSTSSLISTLALVVLSVISIIPKGTTLHSRPTAEEMQAETPSASEQIYLWDDPLPSAAGWAKLLPPQGSFVGYVPIIVGIRRGARADEIETRIRTRHTVARVLLDLGYESSGLTCFECASPADTVPSSPGRDPILLEAFRTLRKSERNKGVLIIWLDEGALLGGGLKARLSRIADAIHVLVPGFGSSQYQIPYIGPTSSDVLSEVATFAKECDTRREWLTNNFDLWITSSTVDKVQHEATATLDAHILVEGDDSLFLMLMLELSRRGFCGSPKGPEKLLAAFPSIVQSVFPVPNRSILVLSEADTEYGRSWARRFSNPSRFLISVFSYAASSATYLPIIDPYSPWRLFDPGERAELASILSGLGPGAPGAGEKLGSTGVEFLTYLRGLDGRGRISLGRDRADSKDADTLHRSVGTQQFDYVIRDIRNLLRRVELKEAAAPEAVLLFGTDLYDKLSLLRVLRQELPTATILTTDLDARFLDSSERLFTQNLVIISHNSLARGAPTPRESRDELQLALAAGIERVLSVNGRRAAGATGTPAPQLVATEVGRSRFVECERRHFSAANPGEVIKSNFVFDLTRSVSDNWIWVMVWAGALVFLIILLFEREHSKEITRPQLFALAVVLAVVLVFVLVVLAGRFQIGITTEEPLNFLEGVSIWPTSMLLVIASIIGFIALLWVLLKSTQILQEICRQFSDRPSSGPLQDAWRKIEKPSRGLRYYILLMPVHASLFCVLVILVVKAFPDPIGFVRGELAMWTLWCATFMVTGALALLIGFLSAQTAAVREFVSAATEHCAELSRVDAAPEKMRVVRELDSAFGAVVEYSRRTSALVYAPLAIVALHLLSQVPAFDRFGYPMQTLLIYGIVVGWLVLLTMGLAVVGAKLRNALLQSLQRELKSPGLSSENRDAIESTIKGVLGASEGLFAPILQTPLFRAALIPSGSLGVPALLSIFGIRM